MISGFLSSAISGLNANAQRVSAAADNLANVSTDGYQRSDVFTTSVVTGNSATDTTSAGGVQTVTRTLVNMPPAFMAASTTDVGLEFANIIMAASAYRANLKTLEAGEDMSRQLTDIIT